MGVLDRLLWLLVQRRWQQVGTPSMIMVVLDSTVILRSTPPRRTTTRPNSSSWTELSIGGSDSDAMAALGKLRAVHEAPDGVVYVLDSDWKRVPGFDSEGTPIRTIGSGYGRSAGQFMLPAAMSGRARASQSRLSTMLVGRSVVAFNLLSTKLRLGSRMIR